jgi:hypothetical protein
VTPTARAWIYGYQGVVGCCVAKAEPDGEWQGAVGAWVEDADGNLRNLNDSVWPYQDVGLASAEREGGRVFVMLVGMRTYQRH